MGYVWYGLIILVFCLFIYYVFFDRKKKPLLYNLFAIIQIFLNYYLAEAAGKDIGNVFLIYIILCTLVGMIISWIVYFMSKTFGKISELKIPADKKELQLEKIRLFLKSILISFVIALVIICILL